MKTKNKNTDTKRLDWVLKNMETLIICANFGRSKMGFYTINKTRGAIDLAMQVMTRSARENAMQSMKEDAP